MVRLCEGADDIQMTKKQSEVVNVLKDTGSVSVRELCYFTGYTPSVISALEKKGAVECFEREELRSFVSRYAVKVHMTAASCILPTNSRELMKVLLRITGAARVKPRFSTELPEAARHLFI